MGIPAYQPPRGARILHAVKLVDGSNEEWTVPLDTLREAVQRAVRDVAKTPEHVFVRDVQIIAKSMSAVEIVVTLEASIITLGIGDLDEEARAALGGGRQV